MLAAIPLLLLAAAPPADGERLRVDPGAGNNTFSWKFITYYGINKDNLVVMNSFLEGQMSADDARKGLQAIVDKAAADTSKPKLQVS